MLGFGRDQKACFESNQSVPFLGRISAFLLQAVLLNEAYPFHRHTVVTHVEENEMRRFTSVVIGGLVSLGMCFEAQAVASVSEAYGKCKTEVKEKLGGATRVKLKGSKKYKGTVTVKLSVVPEGAPSQRLQCKVSSDSLVLVTNEGTPIS